MRFFNLEKYFIVDSSILPDSFEKVIQTRKLLESGKSKNVSEAVKIAGISRGTYYKYKDLIFLPEENHTARKAVISMLLNNELGILSSVLTTVSNLNASVLTINQNIPIHNLASVGISLDVSQLNTTIDNLIEQLTLIEGTSSVQLVSID